MNMQAVILFTLAGLAAQAQSQTDAPKRTIVDSSPARNEKKADAPKRDAGSNAFDALVSSTENLNAIRDSNVRRLGEGCSPDVAARITDLRARLGIKTGPVKKDPNSEAAMLSIAAGWFKSAAENPPTAPQPRKSDLLEAVLPGADRKTEAAQDSTALQAELNRLTASCAGGRR